MRRTRHDSNRPAARLYMIFSEKKKRCPRKCDGYCIRRCVSHYHTHLGQFSKIDYSTAKRMPTPNDTCSESALRQVPNADLVGTGSIPTVEISSMEKRPGRGRDIHRHIRYSIGEAKKPGLSDCWTARVVGDASGVRRREEMHGARRSCSMRMLQRLHSLHRRSIRPHIYPLLLRPQHLQQYVAQLGLKHTSRRLARAHSIFLRSQYRGPQWVLRVAISTAPVLSGSGRVDMPTCPIAAA